MLGRLYDWTLKKAASPAAKIWLFIISFAESSIFPIPPDVLLVPMCLARRAQSFAFAGICTLGSVLGGVLGYAIGALFFATIGQAILGIYGGQAAMADLRLLYAEQGFMIVAFAAFTPFPFKVVTIASGAMSMDLGSFVIASFLARGGRFLIEAALLWRFGEQIRQFIEKRLTLVTLIIGIAAIIFILIGKGIIN